MYLWQQVEANFKKGDFSVTIRNLEKLLSAENITQFKGLIGVEFTNPPEAILQKINNFISFCNSSFEIQAVYLEMNGFSINPECWFFDFFGYTQYSNDQEDLDWLSDWQSSYWPSVTLTGLEAVQADFEWYHDNKIYNDDNFSTAYEISEFLVLSKYVELISRAIRSDPLIKSIPVLATAHDYDAIGRFEP